jgi:hypothetical protein
VGKTDDEIRQRLRWAEYTGVGIRAESDSYRCLVVNEKGGAHVNEDQMRRIIREELEVFFSYELRKHREISDAAKGKAEYYASGHIKP